MKQKYLLIILVALTVLVAGYWAKSKIQAGAEAYVYGYPFLLVEATKDIMLQEESSNLNEFTHTQFFPDHSFRKVVRPNNDTLYSVAWLDLSDEPIVLSVPNTQGRYYVMPFMDAATNVFASVGKRATGTEAGDYLLSGPDWEGGVPEGVEQISAPGNSVWLIGRIQTNDAKDIQLVSHLQTQFGLSSLSGYRQGKRNISHTKSLFDEQSNSAQNPSLLVENFTASEFLQHLGRLLSRTHLPDQDKPALQSLATLGVDPQNGFDPSHINALELWLVEAGFNIAKRLLIEGISERKSTESSWVVLREGLGRYGVNYGIRAAVAKIGLGALPPEEAAYPNSQVDDQGRPLNGQYAYTLHFPAGQLPPVDAFWSLAMYDEQGFFTENDLDRYSIGSRNQLDLNADGSLTLYIQHTPPSSGTANWLPSPQGAFALTLRLYLPRQAFLDGSWAIPPIQRADKPD